VSHWIEWICRSCGRLNHSRAGSLPTAPQINAKCTACRASNPGVDWTEGKEPKVKPASEVNGYWTCPSCKARNETSPGVEGGGRVKCGACDEVTIVMVFGGLDAPPGELDT